MAVLKLQDLDDSLVIFTIPFGAYMELEAAASCCTSSWRRPEDTMIPPGVKVSGLYVNSVLAKSEAVAAGFDEAILLNQAGYVSEGTGENLFMLRDGKLVTPPLEDNVLPGITRDTVMDIARNELGLEVEERHILRSELYIVDELFLTGTAAHLTPVGRIDNRPVGDGNMGPVTRQLQSLYFDIVRGKSPKYRHWCTPATPRLVTA